MNRIDPIEAASVPYPDDRAPAPAPLVFTLRNVACTFGGLGGVQIDRLDLRAGCSTAIMGRSGSGKTTLLHLLGGMLMTENGRCDMEFKLHLPDGQGEHDLSDPRCWIELRRRIGFVFQDPFLFRDATCRTNLATSLAAAGQRIDHNRIDELWSDLALDRAKLDQPARALSGGMQQRVALARALVRDPLIIFADEPTASLDPGNGDAVMRLLSDWQRARPGRSMLLITHDTALAARWVDEVVVLSLPTAKGANPLVGRPSPARNWPVANPRSATTLRFWMEEETAPSVAAADLGQTRLEPVESSGELRR